MLYLTIPLGLALVALLGAAVIIWRKMSFLRRLTPESHEMGDTWLPIWEEKIRAGGVPNFFMHRW